MHPIHNAIYLGQNEVPKTFNPLNTHVTFMKPYL